MQVLCILPQKETKHLTALAEGCLAFSPQVALSAEAVFVEIESSRGLFSFEEVLRRTGEMLAAFGVEARVACAPDLPTALAFARHGVNRRERLPVEALADYLSPFAPQPFLSAELFRKLGVENLADFLEVPRRELASRFGKEGVFARERFERSPEVAWPRFTPPEILHERADFDFASRIESLEPLLFLLRTLLHRIFLRLHARREKLVEFDIFFHLNRFSEARNRVSEIRLPLPQSDQKALLQLLQDRLGKELDARPLEEALEGISLLVRATAPATDAQKNFFSKAEEEREGWASLVARLRERLGPEAAFVATPAPRLRPEASWRRSAEAEVGETVSTPLRPLRLFPPLPLARKEDRLFAGPGKNWQIRGFHGPERLSGEWWLDAFAREYYRVETEKELLWVFRSEEGLFLHGIFD